MPVVRPLKASRGIGSSAPHRGVVKDQQARAARPSAVGERSCLIEGGFHAGLCFAAGSVVRSEVLNSVGLSSTAGRHVIRAWFSCSAASQGQRAGQGREGNSAVAAFHSVQSGVASTGQRVVGGQSCLSLHPVLANNSLNRTRHSMPSSGPTFHSGPAAVTPWRSG